MAEVDAKSGRGLEHAATGWTLKVYNVKLQLAPRFNRLSTVATNIPQVTVNMKFTIAAVAAFAAAVNAQSECLAQAASIPACAIGYLVSAASSISSCDLVDFHCQCSASAQIQAAIAGNAATACTDLNAVIQGANSLCACASSNSDSIAFTGVYSSCQASAYAIPPCAVSPPHRLPVLHQLTNLNSLVTSPTPVSPSEAAPSTTSLASAPTPLPSRPPLLVTSPPPAVTSAPSSPPSTPSAPAPLEAAEEEDLVLPLALLPRPLLPEWPVLPLLALPPVLPLPPCPRLPAAAAEAPLESRSTLALLPSLLLVASLVPSLAWLPCCK